LPTFERPAKAISGKTSGGYWDVLTALVTNSADLMIILVSGVLSLVSGVLPPKDRLLIPVDTGYSILVSR